MLPSELAVTVVGICNLVLAIQVTRREQENGGYLVPLLLWLLSETAYSVASSADLLVPHRLILSDEARMVWELSTRLQGGLSLFVLLLNYAAALHESRAYRSIQHFLNELGSRSE